MPEVTLYHFMSCPYCTKVRNYLEGRGIDINMKDTRAFSEHREELIQIGGKSQVPCLVVGNQAIYESDAIIQWFEENWK